MAPQTRSVIASVTAVSQIGTALNFEISVFLTNGNG